MYIYKSKFNGKYYVNAELDINDHIRIYGEIIHVGNTSLTIRLEARRRELFDNTHHDVDPLKREVLVCSTSVVFVQIDRDGRSLKFSEEQLHNLQ